MRIILAPAKKMKPDLDSLEPESMPVFLEEAQKILNWLRTLSFSQLRDLWKCSDRIAEQNLQRIRNMDLHSALSPAILTYDGIAFQYMAPVVFEDAHFAYVQEHLRILSGFYGVLRPMDGVVPYRLEMQAKAAVAGTENLYAFWGDRIYRETLDDSRVFINLASKEYSKCIEKYLQPSDTFLTCVFGELIGGKVVQKGVYAKMARGEMVRFLAEKKIEDPGEMRGFDRLGYVYREDLSNEREFIFIK